MRSDSLQFAAANLAPAKSPRFVVAILYDVGSLYITSHSDISGVPGIVIQGALQRPSAISQRIVPDEGRSEIGTFSFDLVDIDSEFTDEVRTKLAAGAGLRGRRVQLWVGYRGFAFSAFQLFQTQVVSEASYQNGVYTIDCEDITRQARTDVFDLKTTTLAASISATDTVVTVADTTSFLPVAHGPFWNDGPSQIVYYFKIDREVIRATGKSATTFTGCTRGVMNTAAAPHTVDASTAQDKRPKVEEFVYLDLPAPKLALAILTGGIFDTWPANMLGSEGTLQTDSNADGRADGWSVSTVDGGRVQTASLVAGSSPFTGNAQRLAITSVTTADDSQMYWSGPCAAGPTFTASAYIRTNATGVYLQIGFLDANDIGIEYFSSSTVAADSIAHLTQVTGIAPARTHRVFVQVRGINAGGEFFEFDSVMIELGSTVNTFTQSRFSVLPQNWHCGIAPEFIRFSDFTAIGPDLWQLADDSSGFRVRFEGLTKQDGKRFLEKEVYLLLGGYSPIYSDGTLGLKRLPAMISTAAPVATLTERELVAVGDLRHTYSSLHNRIRVTWGYDLGLGSFTRDSLFLDGTSIEIHGAAPVMEYQFRGLHSGSHTDAMIRLRMDAIRDAYAYPPEQITVTGLPSLNVYEMGDVFRLRVNNVRDFAGSVGNIDRSFLCLRRSIDFATGSVVFELFGSTSRPEAQAPSTEGTAPLPDGFYNALGVALSSVVPMTGNTVNAGSHTISGASDMTASGSVFYHLGDLVIPDGATITIGGNVQLRVRGFLTLNGDIVGTGNGHSGVADPGGAPLTAPIAGTSGFIGHSRGRDGVEVRASARGVQILRTVPPALVRARYDAWPPLNLQVSGTSLLGIPTDLRGSAGAPGGRTVLTYNLGTIAAGGAGADGGAGLAIVCRGMSFGVSASITLDGEDSAATSVTTVPQLPDVYPGAGGAGGPGACLILLDGNALTVPTATGRFFASTGAVPLNGTPMRARDDTISGSEFTVVFPEGLLTAAWSGYPDEQVVSDLDLSQAALRIAYVPTAQTPAANQNELPGAITDLTVTPGAGFNTVRATLPPLDSFDVVDYYAAVTNDRTGAVRIARGRSAEFQHDLPALTTRYYWARTVRLTALGLEQYSDFFPVSSTGGVSATTLNPGGWTPVVTSAGGATMLATASTIEKSGGISSWDSQAYSAESYPACAASWRANDATHDFMMGLNTDPATNAVYTSIDFCWYCVGGGALQIYESGAGQVFSGTSTYDATTVLSVTYDGEYVRYYRNGVLARSVPAPGLTLALDSSFYTPGAKALDVKFTPMALAANGFNAVVRGNNRFVGRTIWKDGGSSAWDSDVYSVEAFARGAAMSFMAGQTNLAFMVGLNSDPTTDQNFSSIDFAWYCQNNATLQIYESGVSAGSFGAYSTSTVLGITYDGERVRYVKDGVLVREVLVPGRTLAFDCSLNEPGAKVLNITYQPHVSVTNAANLVANGTALYAGTTAEKPTGSSAYDSSVYSTESMPACFLEFTPVVGELAVGLNSDPLTDNSYTSIDYAWLVTAGGTDCRIYESGSLVSSNGTWTAGSTVLSINYDGQYVRYIKDGSVIREVLRPGRSFYFDSTLYHVGAKAQSIRFGPSARAPNAPGGFVARTNCVVVGDSIEKIGGSSAWDSDCYSTEAYTQGSFCSARASFTNCDVMFGLNSDPTTDQNYTSIDYAWIFDGTGVCSVYESGAAIASFGSYTTATILSIAHVGNLVQYYKDGVVVRSVTRTSTSALFFDSSFYTAGARLQGVRFGPAGRSAEADPSAVFLETFENVWEASWANVSNASNVVITYPANGQLGGKVLSAQRQLYIMSNENVPYDANALYRITARIRRTVSGGGSNELVYVGVAGVAQDGVTLINEAGANSAGSQHYNCARSFDMAAVAVNTWQDFVGWFSGHGTSGFGVAANNDSPSPLYTGTAFFRPLVIANYNTGSGTQEIDFIKVERLVNADDADNSDKARVVPDTEFTRATDETYWWQFNTGSSSSPPAISLSGGALGGYCRFTQTNVVHTHNIVSRRRLPYQCATGELYTVTIRARDPSNTFTGFLKANVIRHACDGSSAAFSGSGTYLDALGGLFIDAADLTTDWQEFSGICFLQDEPGYVGGDLPLLSALVGVQLGSSGTADVDLVSVAPGANCPPQPLYGFTTSTDFNGTEQYFFKDLVYNSASPGTYTLPVAEPEYIGAKFYGQQIGAGLLSIAVQGGDTLQSSPNTTGTRALAGRYGRFYAEVIAANVWRLIGNLA